jgi:hypothetical protein
MAFRLTKSHVVLCREVAVLEKGGFVAAGGKSCDRHDVCSHEARKLGGRNKAGRVESRIVDAIVKTDSESFRLSMEETDEVTESVKFGLHNSPRLLAKSAEETSKELFKQVQWYFLNFSQ